MSGRLARFVVSFSRQASDGNYGSETARLELVYDATDDAGLDADTIPAAQVLARSLVHEQLDESPNWNVRRAIKPPALADRGDFDDDEDDR
jgi:hypothetical protein